MMIYPSQRDPLWRNDFLGKSRSTIGRYGCTTTSISCLSSFYDQYTTPKDLARTIEYTYKKKYPNIEEGLILWQSINKLDLPFRWIWREYQVESFYELRYIAYHPTKSATLNIAYGKHWVTLLNVSSFKTLIVHDPFGGLKKRIKWTDVVGYSVFDKR